MYQATTAEENYLKAIFKIAEKEKKSVSTNSLARALQTSPASITDMIKKMADKNLLNYEKYKGVTLTIDGNKIATELIRRHRLWEVFLVEKLRFAWHQVHEIAEELEHIGSPELITRLDAFLDYPKFDPHGDPIPNAEGRFTIRTQLPLGDLGKNIESVLLGVKEHSTPFLEYLHDLNIKIGTNILIKERTEYDHSLSILVDKKREISISQQVAQNLLVKRV
ncbi:MAG: metal-dependent transcriptional regulator [Saprospiraceae bacterium]|nr:metal-dependent transcriptional regulator [Saprospiraceae bacterium]